VRANMTRITFHVLRLSLLVVALALSACAPAVVRHNEAGNERFAENAFQDAVNEYRLAQVADPDRAEPYYNSANAYNRLGQIDAALAQTRQALKTADPALAAQAWYNLGNAYFDARQWSQAIEAYKEALRLQPDDPDAKHNLELALQKLQKQQQEQQQAQQEQQKKQQQDQRGGQQNEQAKATPTPENEAASSEQGGERATPQAAGAPQEAQGMTEEQARRLLQALLGDSQTLQEHLQRTQPEPGSPPAQDW